jgi:hypothetical protein
MSGNVHVGFTLPRVGFLGDGVKNESPGSRGKVLLPLSSTGASPGGRGTRTTPLRKIFEIDRENPLHRKKYLKLTVRIRIGLPLCAARGPAISWCLRFGIADEIDEISNFHTLVQVLIDNILLRCPILIWIFDSRNPLQVKL